MKKVFLILVCLLAICVLFSCGKKDGSKTDTPTEEVTTVWAPETDAPVKAVKLSEIPANADPVARFAEHPAIFLWDDPAAVPGYDESTGVPSLIPYLVPSPKAMIVLYQGGDYQGYNTEEGEKVALKLNESGYSVSIVKYRLMPTAYENIEKDAQRAVRFLNHYANEFGTGKICMLGFGSGGHLALNASRDSDSGLTTGDEIDKAPSCPDSIALADPTLTEGGDGYCSIYSAAKYNKSSPVMLFVYPTGGKGSALKILDFAEKDLKPNKVRYDVHGFRMANEHTMGLGEDDPAYGEWFEYLLVWLDKYY